MPKTQEISFVEEVTFSSGLRWVNITRPGKKQLAWLSANFGFDKDAIKNCGPENQRPKLSEYSSYNFMVLQFPVYNKAIGEIESSEIDFFISNNYLVTVHSNKLSPVIDLFKKYTDSKMQDDFENTASLLFEILRGLLHYCFPMLNHISQDIDAMESYIFKIEGDNVATVREILRIKRNIVDFRKIMQAHKSIIQKLISKSEKLFTTHKLKMYYSNLLNHTKDIWDFLSNYKDTVDALHETHESLVSHRLNQIIKTLTIFSVIVFPLTLLAAVFGMNTMNSMPFVNSPFDFWIVVGIMLIGLICMIIFFKKKKWM